MIEAEHLPHPDNLPEMLMENNAMLQVVLNNQAFMLEMITATYQMLRYHIYKNPSPDDTFVREKTRLAMEKYEAYKVFVAQIFELNSQRYGK